jgi:hypothetical protein
LTETTVAVPDDTLVYGQSTSFTATVQSGGIATGQVQFRVGGEDDGAPVAVDALGHARHEPDFLLDVGDVVSATYGGDAHWGWSFGESSLRILPARTTTTLATTPNPVLAGGEVDTIVTVHNASTDITPFGSVQFSVDGAPIGPRLELDDGGQVAVVLDANVSAGAYRVRVDYLDDTAPIADFAPSSASVVETVTVPASGAPVITTPRPSTPRKVTKRDLTKFAARLARTLRRRGLVSLRRPGPAFTASGPGTLSQRLYALSAGRRRLLASGRHTFTAPGSRRLRLRLTATGKRLIRRGRAVRTEIRTTFAPTSGRSIVVTRRLKVAKGKPTTVIALRTHSAARNS